MTNPTPAPVTAADTEQARQVARRVKITVSTSMYNPVSFDREGLVSDIARALAAVRQATREADAVICRALKWSGEDNWEHDDACEKCAVTIEENATALRAQAGKETK